LEEANRVLKESDLFYEGNPFVGRKLKDAFEPKVDILSIFLAPLAREENSLFAVARSACVADRLCN
jgi:hypothetical protein